MYFCQNLLRNHMNNLEIVNNATEHLNYYGLLDTTKLS